MLRRKLRRRLLAAACIVLGTSSAIAFVIAKTIYAADKNGQGYIHGIETNAELTDALETLGVTTISFGLKCPPGHKAVVARAVTDKTGKTIENSSMQTVGFCDEDAQREWTVRISKVDPRAFIQDYSGYIRWRMVYRSEQSDRGRSSGSNEQWDRDWFHAQDARRLGSTTGPNVDEPVAQKEYTVWQATAHRDSKNDDPPEKDAAPLYRYRVFVKFLKARPGDFNSF